MLRALQLLAKRSFCSVETTWGCARMEPEDVTSMDLGPSKQLDSSSACPDSTSARSIKKPKREFDFTKYSKRHVALRLAYLGWDYHGFATQTTVENTIEARLFEALLKTKLVEAIQTCNYSRCGRTDAGVSALGQVVALHLRSNLLEGPGVMVPEGSTARQRKGDTTTELPYVRILNAVLPTDIRALSWAPVSADFSARFSCLQRTYKYFFPRGEMNIEVMQEAAKLFLGEHDFRNFCKMDIGGGVRNFRRTISSFEIVTLDSGSSSPHQMCEMTVRGKAFLWHQVRCMVAILFLVGMELEQPQVITHMLDVEKTPGKPQYGMASELPLVLYDSTFEELKWEGLDAPSQTALIRHFQEMWTSHMIRSTMLRRMLDSLVLTLHPSPPPPSSLHLPLLPSADHRPGRGSYKPLLSRPSASTLEERLLCHASKKQKLDPSTAAVDET